MNTNLSPDPPPQKEFASPPSTLTPPQILARSALMYTVLEQARRLADRKVSVLIEGESGTGKELLARLIHLEGPRAKQPFVAVNCSAFAESLIESEWFGHERGAFTGATESRAGRFELASGGTLLLDEISEIPGHLQAKLLRVLEEEEVQRVGSNRSLAVDVRIVATSNRNLEVEVAQGGFRRDLYYRLNVVALKVPPLRERREDIPLLVDHYLARYRDEARLRIEGVSGRTMSLLCAYDWPGNVRQLRNVMHRACILAGGRILEPSDLPTLESATPSPPAAGHQTLEEIERQVILQTLQECQGNRGVTARRLGVSTRTLLNKMNKYRRQSAA